MEASFFILNQDESFVTFFSVREWKEGKRREGKSFVRVRVVLNRETFLTQVQFVATINYGWMEGEKDREEERWRGREMERKRDIARWG